MIIYLKIVSFGLPGYVNDYRLVRVKDFWKEKVLIEFHERVLAPREAMEMQEWGDALAVLDTPVVNRWKDVPPYSVDLTVLVGPYQPPKSFLGLIYDRRASVMGLYLENDRVIEVFANESDHSDCADDGDAYKRVQLGPTFELYLNHELSHHFYQHVLRIPDRTHEHFYAGHPERARAEIFSRLP